MSYYKMDTVTGDILAGPGGIPLEFQGLSDSDLADLSWVGEPLFAVYDGVGYWPEENNDQAFDPATEVLDDSTLTLTPVKSRSVVKTRRTKRTLTADELDQRNPTPDVISDRQFFHALSKLGLITKAEAEAYVATGTIPNLLQDAIDTIPDADAKHDATMLIVGANTFQISHPMTQTLAGMMGYTPAQLRTIFRKGAEL